ncbi:MAG: hypothetical protein F4060_03490 [Holophagales bacterium]|nr:hypothetical protein [Holophagales bacterium]MYI78984.1 hypothetical protein [Holophagales bacterium]
MNWKRLQSIAVVWSAVFLGLAILTIVGVQLIPRDIPGLVWVLHVLVAAIGFLSGIAATRRRAEIDVERWKLVEDPDLTSGEREHAHREAESRLRRASAQFLLAGVTLGGWLAYQLRSERPEAGAAVTRVLGGETPDVPSPDQTLTEALAAEPVYTLSPSDLLIVTPLIAFGLGMLWARYQAGRSGERGSS